MKRRVFKTIPDEVTRLAMLKRGEADIAYTFRGLMAEEVRRTAGLTLKPTQFCGDQWVLHRAVGSEIALGRPACASGRQP